MAGYVNQKLVINVSDINTKVGIELRANNKGLFDWKISNKQINKNVDKEQIKYDMGAMNTGLFNTTLGWNIANGKTIIDPSNGRTLAKLKGTPSIVAYMDIDICGTAVNTFKWLGMDIDDDMNAVIKSDMSTIKVFNLMDVINKGAVAIGGNEGLSGIPYDKEGFAKDIIELMKFDSAYFVDKKRDTILRQIVDDNVTGSGAAVGSFQSIVLNYLEVSDSKTSKSTVNSVNDVYMSKLCRNIGNALESGIESYKCMSVLVTFLSKYFNWLAMGTSTQELQEIWNTTSLSNPSVAVMAEAMTGNPAQYSEDNHALLANFSGFRTQDNLLSAHTVLEPIKSSVNDTFAEKNNPSRDSINTLQDSMSGYMDSLESVEEMMQVDDSIWKSASALDFIGFRDPDLAITGYNIKEDGDLIMSNMVKVLGHTFGNYNLKSLAGKVIDILNKKVENNTVGPMISGTSQQSQSITKCARLVDKVSKSILQKFK